MLYVGKWDVGAVVGGILLSHFGMLELFIVTQERGGG